MIPQKCGEPHKVEATQRKSRSQQSEPPRDNGRPQQAGPHQKGGKPHQAEASEKGTGPQQTGAHQKDGNPQQAEARPKADCFVVGEFYSTFQDQVISKGFSLVPQSEDSFFHSQIYHFSFTGVFRTRFVTAVVVSITVMAFSVICTIISSMVGTCTFRTYQDVCISFYDVSISLY